MTRIGTSSNIWTTMGDAQRTAMKITISSKSREAREFVLVRWHSSTLHAFFPQNATERNVRATTFTLRSSETRSRLGRRRSAPTSAGGRRIANPSAIGENPFSLYARIVCFNWFCLGESLQSNHATLGTPCTVRSGYRDTVTCLLLNAKFCLTPN